MILLVLMPPFGFASIYTWASYFSGRSEASKVEGGRILELSKEATRYPSAIFIRLEEKSESACEREYRTKKGLAFLSMKA